MKRKHSTAGSKTKGENMIVKIIARTGTKTTYLYDPEHYKEILDYYTKLQGKGTIKNFLITLK